MENKKEEKTRKYTSLAYDAIISITSYLIVVLIVIRIWKKGVFPISGTHLNIGIAISLAIILAYLAVKYLYQSGCFDKRIQGDISRIDKMSERAFGEHLKARLRNKGWSIKHSNISKDGEVILVLTKPIKVDFREKIVKTPEKMVVLGMVRSDNAGGESVLKVIKLKNSYRAGLATVITNQNFTKEAKKIAKENNVILLGRNYLQNQN